MPPKENHLSSTDKQLLHAAAMGILEHLQLALQRGANPHSRDEHNNTPLHLACMQSNSACTEALLSIENIELNHCNDEGFSPIMCAIEYGEEDNALAILRSGKTHTLPPTCLHRASYWGQTRVVQKLCELRICDVLQEDKQHHTPLYYATRYGHAECLQLLLNAVPKEKLPHNLLSTAIEYLHGTCADMLLQQGGANDCPAIEKAILTEDTASLKSAQAQLMDYRCIGNLPPLHLAAALNKCIALEALLQLQAEYVNTHDAKQNTPLHYAAMQGNEQCIRLLLRHAAIDPNVLNEEHATPLNLACWHGYSRSVQALLEHEKTDLNTADEDGWSPLCWAAYWGHTTCLQHLLHSNKHLNINQTTESRETALHLAANKGRLDCLKLLLQTPGINTKLKDAHGSTAIKRAKQKGHTECVKLLKSFN